ncbi:MAG TPA: histidine kinase N-terminal domain-containing protein [Nocardioidaceae bacterium]|nr:histidine kinase N-terminal domain-containing protein [Nocardioidaceae bacterium]
MPTLDDVLRHHTALSDADLAWLHRLLADWQIIADLSFADLILWLPDAEGRGFWAGAQMRPTTGPTAYVDDIVGSFVPQGRRPLLDLAWRDGRIVREGDPEWRDEVPVRVETIPVRRDDALLGVIARSTNLMGVRTPSRLELAYLQTAAELTKMISQGRFPTPGERSELADSMRVGDGFVRTDVDGVVRYASPNAMSAFRRLGLVGDLVGVNLADMTRSLVPPSAEPVSQNLRAVLDGQVAREAEVENAAAALVIRAIPLSADGQHLGGLVLLRDVTDLRSRERELVTREATIREIHHRVKNNLQTVAALLRLQARRLSAAEGRAALDEAVQRVAAIAVVHETLSQGFDETVDFDQVMDQLRHMVVEVASPGAAVTTERRGSFGTVPAAVATSLAMVLTEAMQNAVVHGFDTGPGHVVVTARRFAGRLEISVEDDGRGLPEGFDPETSSSLGMSIMRTLVEGELSGRLVVAAGAERGTCVRVHAPLT